MTPKAAAAPRIAVGNACAVAPKLTTISAISRPQHEDHLRSAGTTRPPQSALQLLGADDVGVSKVQRKLRLHLPAPACPGRPALFGDPYL
jgi:hypothetical protein